jgi:uncharacterized membrane protein
LITIGLFLNPLGYDWVVYGINQLTNDYWLTMTIMYFLAMTFFGLFAYFSEIKLYRILKYNTIKTKKRLTKKISRNE